MRIVRPLILLLFFSLLITCGHNTPPPSPPPVPPPCSNCPPPQTQPTPPPSTTCKLPDDASLLFFGYYGIGSSAGLTHPDFEDTIICKSHYVGVDQHGLGSVCQNGIQPWPYKNGKYDLAHDNPAYYVALREEATEIKKRNGVLYFTYFNRPHNCVFPHPFIANTYGFNWGGDPRMLYNNYDWGKHAQTWLHVTDESKPETFTPTVNGEPLVRYVDNVNQIFKDTGVRLMIRMFNEEFCTVMADGHCGQPSAGDISFLDDWGAYKLKKIGVKNFIMTNDFTPFNPLPDPTKDTHGKTCMDIYNDRYLCTINWTNLKKAAQYTIAHGRLQELHHCRTEMLQMFVAKTGISGSKVDCSADGLPEDPTYYLAAESIEADVKLGHAKAGDQKFYAGAGAHWNEQDIQKNMTLFYAPLQEKLGRTQNARWFIHGENPVDRAEFTANESEDNESIIFHQLYLKRRSQIANPCSQTYANLIWDDYFALWKECGVIPY